MMTASFKYYALLITCAGATNFAVPSIPDLIHHAFRADHVVLPSSRLLSYFHESPVNVEKIRCELFGAEIVSPSTLLPPHFTDVLHVIDLFLSDPLACSFPGILSSYTEDLMRFLEKDGAYGDSPLVIDLSVSWMHAHVSVKALPELASVLRRQFSQTNHPSNPLIFRLALDVSHCLGVNRAPGELLLRCLTLADTLREELSRSVEFDELMALHWTLETVESVFFNVVLFDLFRASEFALLVHLELAPQIDQLVEKFVQLRGDSTKNLSPLSVMGAFRAELDLLTQTVADSSTRDSLEVALHNLQKYEATMAGNAFSPSNPAVRFPYTSVHPKVDSICTFRLRVATVFSPFEAAEAELARLRSSEEVTSVEYIKQIFAAEVNHLARLFGRAAVEDLIKGVTKLVDHGGFYGFIESREALKKLAASRRIPAGTVLYGGVEKALSVYAHLPFSISESLCVTLLQHVNSLKNLDETQAAVFKAVVELIRIKRNRMSTDYASIPDLVAAFTQATESLHGHEYPPLQFVTKALCAFRDLLSGKVIAADYAYTQARSFIALLVRQGVKHTRFHLDLLEDSAAKEQLLEASRIPKVGAFGRTLATVGASITPSYWRLAANSFYVDVSKELNHVARFLTSERLVMIEDTHANVHTVEVRIVVALKVASSHISTGLLFRTLAAGASALGLTDERAKAHLVEASRRLRYAARLAGACAMRCVCSVLAFVNEELNALSSSFEQVVQRDIGAAPPVPSDDSDLATLELDRVYRADTLGLVNVRAQLPTVPAPESPAYIPMVPWANLGQIEKVREFAIASFPDGGFSKVKDLDELTSRVLERIGNHATRGRKRRRVTGLDLCAVLLTCLSAELDAINQYLGTWLQVAENSTNASSVELTLHQTMAMIASLKADIVGLILNETPTAGEIAEFAGKLRALEIPHTPYIQPVVSWITTRYADFMLRAVGLGASSRVTSSSLIPTRPPAITEAADGLMAAISLNLNA